MEAIIIQILGFQLCFWLLYELLFRKETFFNWNRSYLLITSLLSLIVPFIKIDFFSNVIPQNVAMNLPTVLIGNEIVDKGNNDLEITTNIVSQSNPSFAISWEHIWYLGVIVFSCILIYKLFKIWNYKKTNHSLKTDDFLIVTLKKSEDAFSFFNTIFLGSSLKQEQQESIIKHEKVHAKELHTLDLLWFELLRIVFWFNPLIYIYQKRITEVHEFIADQQASENKKTYYENLLAKTFSISEFSLVNQFYSSSLIKKRIIMLTKEKSKKRQLIKYLSILPLTIAMLIYVSCSVTELESDHTTTNSEVLKDVSKLMLDASIDVTYPDISVEQYELFKKSLQSYVKRNHKKITQTDLLQYHKINTEMGEKYPFGWKYPEEAHIPLNAESVARRFLTRVDEITYDNDAFILKALTPESLATINNSGYQFPSADKYREIVENAIQKFKSEQEHTEELQVNNAIPFAVLDKSPVFPGCDENASNEELKQCFSLNVAKHINENFNIQIAKELGLHGPQRISVLFKTDINGNIVDIRARASHPALVEETKRVITTLPKMKPGEKDGKTVAVAYSLPIMFNTK